MAYIKVLSEPEKAAKLLDTAPRRVLTTMFHRYFEYVSDVPVVEIITNLLSDHPKYTDQSSMLSKEEMDVYESEYTKSGFQSTCNYYATRRMDFENERGFPSVIPHKALCIGARNDPVLKPAMADHIPPFMPNLEMKTIDEAGRWILWEQPTKVSETLLDWLASVETAAP